MTVMTLITAKPAVSQTPPVLSSRGAWMVLVRGIGLIKHPESPDTTPTAGWKTCRHSTPLDFITGVVCTLQTHTR